MCYRPWECMSRHCHNCLDLQNNCCPKFGLISIDHIWVASCETSLKTSHELFFACVHTYVQQSLQNSCWYNLAFTSTVLFPVSSECISAARSEIQGRVDWQERVGRGNGLTVFALMEHGHIKLRRHQKRVHEGASTFRRCIQVKVVRFIKRA